jgi:hypothetical protein
VSGVYAGLSACSRQKKALFISFFVPATKVTTCRRVFEVKSFEKGNLLKDSYLKVFEDYQFL